MITRHPAAAAILKRHVPVGVLRFLKISGIRVRVLRARERYADASAALRYLENHGPDWWVVAPSGIFVCDERTLYVRNVTVHTTTHECMHALDLGLGGDQYLSSVDPTFRRIFKKARGFINAYAMSSPDEAFAESARALCHDANDADSFWPAATPERLQAADPDMYAYMREIFDRLEREYGKGSRRTTRPQQATP